MTTTTTTTRSSVLPGSIVNNLGSTNQGSRSVRDARCVLDSETLNPFRHIICKESGASFNIEPLDNTSFLVYHKPFRHGENLLTISVVNNKLVTTPKDNISNKQKWIFVNINENDKYVVPYSEHNKVNSGNYNVLQFDNGFLSLRPRGDFNSQKWLYDTTGPTTHDIGKCKSLPSLVNSNGLQSDIENRELHEKYQMQMNNILGLVESNVMNFYNQVHNQNNQSSSPFSDNGARLKINVKTS